MNDECYYPSVTSRQGEVVALARLAEAVKDSIFPIVRIQAWPHPKKGEGNPVERSVDQLITAFGERPIGIDLALPHPPSDKVYKDVKRAEWFDAGRAEVQKLHDPEAGFRNWIEFIASRPNFVPVVQWSDNLSASTRQVGGLSDLGRGLIFRFRRSQGWAFGSIAALSGYNFRQDPIMMIYDCEQISLRGDLTELGLLTQQAILMLNNQISGGRRVHVLQASSWPSEFKSIGEEYACLPIRERQLYALMKDSPPLIGEDIHIRYGDHASVFASDREPAFRGVPRVDYPTRREWVYHRRRAGFFEAAKLTTEHEMWDETNLCWGAQRIREAASGKMDGLNAQGAWVPIRINIHMHVQALYGSTNDVTDEPWVD